MWWWGIKSTWGGEVLGARVVVGVLGTRVIVGVLGTRVVGVLGARVAVGYYEQRRMFKHDITMLFFTFICENIDVPLIIAMNVCRRITPILTHEGKRQ